MLPIHRTILLGKPGWVLPGASMDFDFAAQRYWCGARKAIEAFASTTRASAGYAQTQSGLLVPFAANVPRITDNGLLIEPARTNVALYSRDLTNAAWTKSNVTAALDQTGVDGAANSASSLTATASNGTCLQAITLASSSRFQTAYVKRLTGSGTIEMTMDNGSTWTAISPTSSWSRLSIPTQTLANPTVGFRIATSGDAIAVDFVQNENGAFPTSPIRTTSSSATGAADDVSAPLGSWFNSSAMSIVTKYSHVPGGAIANYNFGVTEFYASSDDTWMQNTDNSASYAGVPSGRSYNASNSYAITSNVADAIAIGDYNTHVQANAFALNDLAMSMDGKTVRTQTTAPIPAVTPTHLKFGSSRGNIGAILIKRVAVFPMRLPNETLRQLSGSL